MKKFIAKVLIFVFVIAAITGCVNFVYMKRDNSDPQDVEKFQNMPSSIMVCNFGSSHGLYGFNYEDVDDMECFNFGLTSQTLSYDKRIFDYYKDNISEGAVVFIPVSYFSLYGNDEKTNDDFLDKNQRYYQILPADLIKDYELKTDIYVSLPSLSAGVNLIKTLLLGSNNTNEENWWSKSAIDMDVKRDAELACERHLFKNKMDENGGRILNQEEIDALKYLISACYEKGCTPILVTTPFMREYTDEIKKADPNFLEGFYSQIDVIVEDTGVLYYDYGFDERFVENYNWFMNSDHLNEEGAREFVNILMDEVVHYGKSDSLIQCSSVSSAASSVVRGQDKESA